MVQCGEPKHKSEKDSVSPLLWAMFVLLLVFPWIVRLLPRVMQDYITVLFR